ncbi:MAG: hypothetical protein AAF098_13650 [Pseudomonadota bacterium]
MSKYLLKACFLRTTPLVLKVLVLVVAATACTQQQIYEKAQQDRALECQKYPDSRYEECMRTIEQSFDDYQQELEAGSSNNPTLPARDAVEKTT